MPFMTDETSTVNGPQIDVAGQSPASRQGDTFDDIFGSSDDEQHVSRENHGELSEDTRLRSIHVTNGYRDGVSESKTLHVQHGFDEGYPLGAVLGFKAAWLLKILQSLSSTRSATSSTQGAPLDSIDQSLAEARKELAMQSLISATYFDESGVWTYPVDGESDSACDFGQVGSCHPLILKWNEKITSIAASKGISLPNQNAG